MSHCDWSTWHADASMTSAWHLHLGSELTGGVPHGGVTNMWPRSTVNVTGQWSIQARPKLGRLGLDTGWALARHVACTGAATSSYWATNRPWSTGAGEARFMVNPPTLVHRPQSRSMKDLVHLLLPRVRFTCTKCTDVWSARGKSPSLP